MVSTAEVIAIVELCVYIPIFFITLILVICHGFNRQLGWIYLLIFCIIRSVGAGFKIAGDHDPKSTTDIEWAAILQSVSLSPLFLASMGLLKRVCDEVSDHKRSNNNMGPNIAHHGFVAPNGPPGVLGKGQNILAKRATANSRRSRIIQITQIPTMIALILCIIGGLNESHTSSSDIKTGGTETKAGVVIFIVVYLLLSALTIITMKDVGNANPGEKRIYFAVLCALPLLAVRLLWSILAAFKSDADFSITGGKPLIQLFMAVLEEFGVVVMYTAAGFTVDKY